MNEEKKQCDSKSCTKEDCAGCSHAKECPNHAKENLNAHSKIKEVNPVLIEKRRRKISGYCLSGK